jgi:predicted acylesterase/phospholipase RssA
LRDYILEEYGCEKLTFIELSKKLGVNLYISTTKINYDNEDLSSINKIFSLENTPDVCIVDAVCASISVPFAFKPYKIGDEYYVDGILSDNFPTRVFNNFKNVDEKNILSIVVGHSHYLSRLSNYDENTSFFEYMSAISKIMMINIENVTNTKNILSNTLIIKDNLPFTSGFSIIKKSEDDSCFKAYTSLKDYEDMILIGYIEITKHIEKRKEDDEICIKNII